MFLYAGIKLYDYLKITNKLNCCIITVINKNFFGKQEVFFWEKITTQCSNNLFSTLNIKSSDMWNEIRLTIKLLQNVVLKHLFPTRKSSCSREIPNLI